ncbi:CPA1 [Bugula neritina]|uniref:CPA1 n=1 Tax=Bugula neritina TaxID=10212 RepID=A0A7J7JR00_BUGNE|nr:CPA1 [Bugula neritina]
MKMYNSMLLTLYSDEFTLWSSGVSQSSWVRFSVEAIIFHSFYELNYFFPLIESAGQHPHGRDKRWIVQLFQRGFQVPDNFASYYQIYKWMMAKEKEFPSIMKVESIGKTYERMEQYIAKIGEPGVDKPIIWIDSGIHGREWISVTTGVNIIDKLLNGYKTKDPQVLELLKNFDWYILPVANPDGYIFTHYSGVREIVEKNEDQLWNGMYGADPNRNGTTNGAKLAAQDYRICLAITESLPNYTQLRAVLVRPLCLVCKQLPQDYRQLLSAGQAAAAAMRKSSGAIYQVGRVPDFIYEASGSSMDWVKATLGTKYVFGLELSQPVLKTTWDSLCLVIR